MLFSRTSEYALQALIYVATRPRDEPVLNKEIASYLHVPAAYLAKVLQTLGRAGLLHSIRGRQGGFLLREGAEKTTLLDVLRIMEGPDFGKNCILGLRQCSDACACPVHYKWASLREKLIALLEGQTLEKLARSVTSGRYRIRDVPHVILDEAA